MPNFIQISSEQEEQLRQDVLRIVKPVAELYWQMEQDYFNIQLYGCYWTVWVEITWPQNEDGYCEAVVGGHGFGVAMPLSFYFCYAGRTENPATAYMPARSIHDQYLEEVEYAVSTFIAHAVAQYHVMINAVD